MNLLSNEDGAYLLHLARSVVEKFTRGEKIEEPEDYPESLKRKCGFFCTIHKITSAKRSSREQSSKKELRGCIGMPYPTMRLISALMSSAKSSCQDPRFPKLSEEELKQIKIEVSVLTEPEPIEAKNSGELLEKIIAGEDGLIIQYGHLSGLFLPQVWDQIPDKEDFLRNLCLKACLYPDTWKDPKTKIYKFHVQVFEEE